MASFNAVTAGNATLATDINQYSSILNGTTAGTVTLLGSSNTTTPFFTYLPTAPASDVTTVYTGVTGDTTSRMSDYIRGADGYGGITAGVGGASHTAHWYATSSGWKTDESIAVATNLTVSGSTSIAALTASGNVSVGGTLAVTGVVTSALQTSNVVWIKQQTAYGTAVPTIALAIGDNDTGIDWLADGNIAIKSNGSVVINIVGGSHIPLTDTSGQMLHVGTATPAGNEGDVWFKS